MHGPIAVFALGVWLSLIANVVMAVQEGAGTAALDGFIVAGHALAVAFPFLFALWGRFVLHMTVRMMVTGAVSDAARQLRDLS